jgi:uncharacterized repeat protein (TIGR03803 family)
MAASGVLYGTTYSGGAHNCGVVFQLAPETGGGGWMEKVIYSFQGGTDGAYPASGVVWQSTGSVLYGTTYGGGTAGLGTVYQVAPGTGGVWTEKVLYSFQGGTDGAYPISDLTLAGSSPVSLVGTTSQGGSITVPAGTAPSGTNPGCAANPDNTPCVYENWGTVFKLTSSSGNFTETLVYTFFGAGDGGGPEAAIIVTPQGVLYGSTFWGGTPTPCATGGYPQGCGVVFALTPTGTGSWTESVLHTFTDTVPDGQHPYRNMALASNGALYGTTYAGGQNVDTCFPAGGFTGCGTIFNVKPPTTPGGPWTKSNLIALSGLNGGAPNGVILAGGGSLFGTTEYGGPGEGYGIVFEWVQ